ncbi:Transposon TX1 uncharacterized 149 kDa protein [Vitis vinifera]|uniref:Transposon TX1 uncharacterized 149 kDa protein n=1 Tax=Vitis vinifera TaxID=29760 RepID=A0A438C4Y0_VITVI|nr:Transposon TX1 uncharacterized 149 kDa protein [Vitis vinifera]
MRGRRNSQKARAMRGLGIMSRGVDSAWNRKDSRSRWRRGEVDCMLRLWRGKVGSRRGQNRSDGLGIVFECLNLSIEDRRMGRWAREWKENGRMYSLSRDYNRGGCFLRLGVVDLEGKRFSVYIPRGKGEKGGWASMADTLRSLGYEESCPKNQKAVVSRTKPNMVKSFVEATKVAKERREQQLGGWGSQLTRIWRLKGSLGLAKMERGKVLLEFEIPAEAEQGKGATKRGCAVVGLPVSMWDRDILRKIGDACGGFLAIDHQTEKMEDLQWARLLVKRNGGSPPSLVEVWIEGFVTRLPYVGNQASHQSSGDWKERKTVVTDAKEGGWDTESGQWVGSEPGSKSERGRAGSSPPASSKAQTEKGFSAMVRSRGPLRSPGVGISNCWGKDDQWGLRCGDETEWGGSPAPIALCWRKTQGVFRPFWNFSGVNQGGLPMQRNWAVTAVCGEVLGLVEISNDSMEDDRNLCLARPISQEEGAWVDEGWEESELARFSHFLGFSTEGLEKDILEFMVKIRKRRERIHSKAMLEKSKFERELRRLECSVNYEGGKKRKGTVQGRGCQIMEETKIQSMNEGMVRSLGAGRFLDWGALEAQGTAGGILICWDKRTLEILEMEMGQFTISCRLRNGIWDDPWCVGGDFNVTLNLGERSNQGRLTGAMRRFAQVTDELELLDIPLHGGVASWSGGRNNQAWARLDRFLVTQDWLDCFSGVLQCRLPRPVSDHFPIILKGGGEAGGRGRASFRVASKLKFLKDKIKSWNREVFGRVEVNKNPALQQVEFWDRVESGRSLTERESELKTEAKEAFKNWVLLEETHWRQSSRELWLREGDKNTGFFHRMANAHRRNNSMDKIKINGRWLEEEREVREGIVNAFQQLLSEDQSWKSDIEGLQLKSLNHAEAEGLEQPFTEAEIHLALMGMNGDKAPGPDGFTVAFWQFCWEFVKEEIVDVFKEFYEDKSPISLLGGVYKLLAKVLSNRIKGVLDKVVSPDQNAFVKGRQILDASLIANEYQLELPHEGHAEDGLWDRWLKWIWWCISTASFSILVNGVPAGYFSNSRGLRQGDPLSPYLFVLGMEVLSAMLRRAVDGGFISARQDHITYLSWILVWFEAASGLRINLAKSEVIPVGEVEDIEMLAVELGCKVGTLPSVYLGCLWEPSIRPRLCGMGLKQE